MIRYYLPSLFIFFTLSLAAELHLKEISTFAGDKHGDFKNNPVAILSDDSAWKIHPLDQCTFSCWRIGEGMRVRVRTSFYFFKREHKFELLNETRHEFVRVMLIKYPNKPLQVVNANSFIAGYRVTAHKIMDHGKLKRLYYPDYIYKTKLQLSDGSTWIMNGDHPDVVNHAVYLFTDHEEEVACILIQGIEREANWHKVKKE